MFAEGVDRDGGCSTGGSAATAASAAATARSETHGGSDIGERLGDLACIPRRRTEHHHGGGGFGESGHGAVAQVGGWHGDGERNRGSAMAFEDNEAQAI